MAEKKNTPVTGLDEEVRQEIFNMCRIDKSETFRLNNYDPGWAGTKAMRSLGQATLKRRAKKLMKNNLGRLSDAQELLYASDNYSLLLIFQAMDAAGKDGTIKHVMSGINPQGCQVFSFKKPSDEELDHHFLWRYTKRMPERGRIGIFNRSYYEEVLVVKVHPEILDRQKLPGTIGGKAFWEARYEDINNLEKHLVRNGTVVLKFFLNLSKEEQRKRFLDRLKDPAKHWKFSEADLAERGYWDQYMEAFETAINATSTEWAPWYVIPADTKWVMRALVSEIVTYTIQSLDLKYPVVDAEKHQRLEEARQHLEKEGTR